MFFPFFFMKSRIRTLNRRHDFPPQKIVVNLFVATILFLGILPERKEIHLIIDYLTET